MHNLKLRREWQEIADKSEEALANQHLIKTPTNLEPTQLPSLNVGDSVQIQNQNGSRPTKWIVPDL